MEPNNELPNSPNTDELAELESLLGPQTDPDPEPQIDWEVKAKSAQKFIADLKTATGANSVKEIKEKIAGMKAPAVEPPKADAGVEDIPVLEVLKLKAEGFEDREILEIHNQAKGMGVQISKLLSNETFKAGIERQREKSRVERASPAPTSKTITFDGGKKSFEDLTPNERKANWSQAIAKVQGKGAKSNE